MAKLVKLTSNIDLDLLAAVFDLWSWNIWIGTHIYILFWTFWCIKCWNRLRNGQVSEIDLQYLPRPPSFQVWPPILKNVKGNLHLFLILSILVYWTLILVKNWPSELNWPRILICGSQMPSLTSDPEKCKKEPTFIFDFEHFGVLNVEMGQEMAKLPNLPVYEVSGGYLEVLIW